jgi:endonuclease G
MADDRAEQARAFLRKITPSSTLEMVAEAPDVSEVVKASLRDDEHDLVRSTSRKVLTGKELTPSEQFALEAIIIPDQRPVINIIGSDFQVQHPLWLNFNVDPIKSLLRRALPSIGRLEVSGIQLPYGGTGFVVGPGIIMTNRHVAALVADGVGTQNVMFRNGLGAGIDFKREFGSDESQRLNAAKVLLVHPYWDMALLAVDGLSEEHPPLTLSLQSPETLTGSNVAVVGYPAYDIRNPAEVQNRVFGGIYYVKRLQPGKLGARRSVQNYWGNIVPAMTHDASTLGGNSGSAVIDAQTGAIVALHFGGTYLDANFTVPTYELARDRHVVALGLKFQDPVTGDEQITRQWWTGLETVPAAPKPAATALSQLADGTGSPTSSREVTWTLPIAITVGIGDPTIQPATLTAVTRVPTERMVEPTHDSDYGNRVGYSQDFLGIAVPPPIPIDSELSAPLLSGGGSILRYHHFSIVMHRQRRLAMFTASNVDERPSKRSPEPGKSYTRKGLGGLGDRDTERWFSDPRIAAHHQLPDRFFTKDQGAFDKGHIVRREDVAWGDSFQEVQFSNGDTFHTTNCSPQVKGFNRPESAENWGDLEKYVTAQGRNSRLSLFAGPVLAPDDPIFVGMDDEGPVRVQIPRQYWKMAIAAGNGGLQVFAFVLRQDLSDVTLEFQIDTTWRGHMILIDQLERLLGIVKFADEIKRADQALTTAGEAVRRMARIELVDA